MSESESFIEEVTEAVRRDRLYKLFRRYGWIAVVAVFLIVGGAAWNEYTKARDRAAAEALGDALLSADGSAALATLSAQDPVAQAVIDMRRAAALAGEGDVAAAAALLHEIEGRESVEPLYRELAGIKALVLEGPQMEPEARIAALDAMAQPGATFRLVALEQKALAQIAAGAHADAVATLRRLLEAPEATQGLRERASQLIVALGEDPTAS